MRTVSQFCVVLFLIVFLFGCSDNEASRQPEMEQAAKESAENQTSDIADRSVTGTVRGKEFRIEQALLNNQTLTLRQGNGFFADKSIDITFFGDDSLENKTIKVDSNTGFDSPHLRLGIKEKNENLPDEKMVLDGYEMVLSFGKADELGMPFSIKLIVNSDAKTDVEGKFFATFKDIRINKGQVDLSYDSFDTFDHLVRQYLQAKQQDFQLHERFGASYSGSGESSYPKVGFVGYEASVEGKPRSIVKVQLYKDEKGWRVINQLGEDKIPQAHPVTDYVIEDKRALQTHLAKAAAGLALERDLNDQSLMPKVRATTASCYLTENLDKASCQLNYGVLEAEGLVCMNKNYLLIRNGEKWSVEKEISETEKVDYTSGELVAYKPFARSCN